MEINFNDHGQISFDPLDQVDALKARNTKAKELRADGYIVHSWTLPNQLKKYSGLGQLDGRVRNVFMIDWRRV